MSDLEYGEHYAVYLTPEKGVRFITNSVTIDTIDELRRGNYGVTDLSMKLNVPVTTMQSNLTKLLRMGMVTTEKDPDDGRKVMYVKHCYCIFRDGQMDEWMPEYKDYVAERIILQDNAWQAAIAMIVIVLLEKGVDTRPVLFEFGNSLAYMYRNVVRGKTPDEILDLVFTIFNIKEGVEYSMDATDEFLLGIKSTDGDSIYKVMCFMNAIVGFLFASLPWSQGFYYSNKLTTTVSDDRRQVLVTAKKKEGKVVVTHLPFIWDRTREFYKMRSPITIVRVPKGTIILGNKTMVSIVDILGKGEMTSEEISLQLDIPAVTVSTAIRKLKAEGIVSTDGRQRGARFRLDGQILVSMTDIPDSLDNDIRWTRRVMIQSLNSDTGDIGDLAYWYNYVSWKLLGLDYEHIIRSNGRYIADKIIKMYPGITADEFVRKACKCRVRETLKAEPVTFIPLRVRVTCIVEPGYPSYPELTRNYFWEILSEGLRKITGSEHPVEMELVTVAADSVPDGFGAGRMPGD